MNKISNLNIKLISFIIFISLIIFTHNLIIPKNIFYLFLKLVFIIPSIALVVNLVNLISKKLLHLILKILGAMILLAIFHQKENQITFWSCLKNGIVFLEYLYLSF